MHGLTVTAHLESGFRNSTNARDAILMGIDRVEHILGGDQLDSTKTAYPLWSIVDTSSKQFKDIVALFVSRHVMFDPTITAPVYFSQLQEGFDYWIDERKFFTPEVQAWVKTKPARHAVASWDSLYWAMRRTTKAFYDAGGMLTLGTDNPSTRRVPRRLLGASRAAHARADRNSPGGRAQDRHDQRRARAGRVGQVRDDRGREARGSVRRPRESARGHQEHEERPARDQVRDSSTIPRRCWRRPKGRSDRRRKRDP